MVSLTHSFFLAMQGPMKTVTQSGSRCFRYRDTATIGLTVLDLYFWYSSGKWWRSMEINAGQQDVVILRPSFLASIHSSAS